MALNSITLNLSLFKDPHHTHSSCDILHIQSGQENYFFLNKDVMSSRGSECVLINSLVQNGVFSVRFEESDKSGLHHDVNLL